LSEALKKIEESIMLKKTCCDSEETELPYEVKLNPIGVTSSSLLRAKEKREYIYSEISKQLKDQQEMMKILNLDSEEKFSSLNGHQSAIQTHYLQIFENLENQKVPNFYRLKKLLNYHQSDQDIIDNVDLIKSNLSEFQGQDHQTKIDLLFRSIVYITEKSNYSSAQLLKLVQDPKLFNQFTSTQLNYEVLFLKRQNRLEFFLCGILNEIQISLDLDNILNCFTEFDLMLYFENRKIRSSRGRNMAKIQLDSQQLELLFKDAESLEKNWEQFMELSQEEKKMAFGMIMYFLVEASPNAPKNLVPKITGMLIDIEVLDEEEVLEIIQSKEVREERIQEAVLIIEE
jgi:hypothetical protein